MKVQIIQLESHDDYISTREKMGWIKTGRILLVWPTRGRILYRKLDMVLLQRHSKTLGTKVALVTSDSDVIHHATQLGIPIFENVRQALGAQWRRKHRKITHIQRDNPPLNADALRELAPHNPANKIVNPWVRIFVFIISLIALLALVSFFIPGAHLKLTPMRKSQQIKINMIASPGTTGVNITGEIPAYSMTTIVEGKDTIITTGGMRSPDRSAIGGVQFTNLTNEKIEIPEGTVVSTLGSEPIRFATTKPGYVDGGIGKNVILPTVALIPGESGNTPAESILAIEGPLGLKLSVLNPMRTHGGSVTIVPSASMKDITTLHQQLVTELENTVLKEFSSQLEQGEVLIEDSLSSGKIIEETYNPPKDQPANQLELTLQLEFEILAVKESDINNLAKTILDANLPDHYLAIPETIHVQPLNQPTVDKDGNITWQVMLWREIVASIDSNQVINMTLGLPVRQASHQLASEFELMGSPDITLIPRWWPRLPYLPFRVQVSKLDLP